MGNAHNNILLRNHWANYNKTLVEWSLDGHFQNCVRWPRLPTKMATKLKIEKRGWNLEKIFSSETTEPISTKLCWNNPWVVPFQNCIRHFIPPTKMAATAEHRTLWEIQIKIFSSETTGPIATKLWWNGPWMAPFHKCVRLFQLPTKMSAKLEIEKGGDEI